MAGWFPMDLDLQDKPEFLCIQATLDIDPDLLVGKLWKFWSWFDEQTTDGVMPRVTSKIIDARIGVKGFAEAMAEAGWLVIDEGGVRIPGFEKRHSNSAKQRLLHARRQSGYRKRGESDNGNSTRTARGQHADSTQPAQDRHLPNQTKPNIPPPPLPPASAEAKAAAAADAKAFVKTLPLEWFPAVDAIRSLNAKRGNWALQVAHGLGYSPPQVVEIVDIGKRHAKEFRSASAAILNRLTTVGPEVPAREEWAAEIPPDPAPRCVDSEVARTNAIRALAAERKIPIGEATAIYDAKGGTAA